MLILLQKTVGLWGTLHARGEKHELLQRREASMKEAHERAQLRAQQKQQQKVAASRESLDKQMELDRQRREAIERRKQQEKEEAERSLYEWQRAQQQRILEQDIPQQQPELKPETKEVFSDTEEEIAKSEALKPHQQAVVQPTVQQQPVVIERPPPRAAITVQTTFTPRTANTPAREPRDTMPPPAPQPTRPPPEDASVGELSVAALKTRGDRFFQHGDAEAAANAYSAALQLEPHNIPYVERCNQITRL